MYIFDPVWLQQQQLRSPWHFCQSINTAVGSLFNIRNTMGVDTSIEEKADDVALSSNATPTPDEPELETGWSAYKVINNPRKEEANDQC